MSFFFLYYPEFLQYFTSFRKLHCVYKHNANHYSSLRTFNERTEQVAKFRPAPPHNPPKGFQEVSTTSLSSKLADTLQANGKQIWHITLPANVPISALKEIDLDKVKNHETIFAHDGTDYGFAVGDESEVAATSLLLPSANGYKRSFDVAKTLHLQQIIRLPGLTNAQSNGQGLPDVSTQGYVPRPKPIRPQPKGLRMRFKPSGFGNDDAGALGWSDSDEEMQEADDYRREKRKHGGVNGPIATPEKAPKKSKKQRLELGGSAPGASDEPQAASAGATKSKKAQKRKAGEAESQPTQAAEATRSLPINAERGDAAEKKKKKKAKGHAGTVAV